MRRQQTDKPKKPMKLWKKIVLIFLALLVISILGIYIWQYENCNALITVWMSDSETIAKEMETKREEHHQAIQKDNDVEIVVKPVTTQQSEDLLNGKTTAEQVKEEMGVLDPNTAASGKEDIINQCVSALYAYKVDVMAHLGGLKQAALDQWTALSPADRTATKKAEIAMDGLHQCYAYEAQVDGHVEVLLEEYRGKMRQIGEDTKPIDDLWYYYCDEKQAEKSYYFDKYLN